MKLYLAGPMRGIPNFNYPAFHAAAAVLRAEGHEVFSPAEHDVEKYGAAIGTNNEEGDEAVAAAQHGFSRREALSADLQWICANAEGIALLPGWQKSKGALAELALAEALDLVVFQIAARGVGDDRRG